MEPLEVQHLKAQILKKDRHIAQLQMDVKNLLLESKNKSFMIANQKEEIENQTLVIARF